MITSYNSSLSKSDYPGSCLRFIVLIFILFILVCCFLLDKGHGCSHDDHGEIFCDCDGRKWDVEAGAQAGAAGVETLRESFENADRSETHENDGGKVDGLAEAGEIAEGKEEL